MQAMVLEFPAPIGSNPLHLVELPPLLPGPGELMIEISYCGVCHTDLHIVEGELPLARLPLVPGHQVVGRVKELGPRTKRFQVGDRVGLAWFHWACGNCRFCAKGLENLCEQAQFTGYHRDGGYAQMTVAPADFAYRLPENFPDLEAAPLLCAGIIGYRALRLSEIKPGGRLGLYGFGASAHIAIQVARYWNCEVFVFTRSPGHQELARKLGAAWVGQAQDLPPAPLDSAIIFAPAGSLVPEALRVLDKGGVLALAGIYMSQIPSLDYEKHLYYEKTVRSVTASTRRDGEELLRLAAEIPIHTETQVFDLAEANKALQLIKAGKINGAAVLAINP
ncbi:zinc-dependent alcohol dehydrogenase family protein [Desulfobacca acetoxidans]|uniref:alcohol dehydrogenase n=1 Tax=Desulfobacca acetoxidans (strain ATCC 700848 / DSM 11109 / ASRB2) TaxID=880072 RepID=F2NDI6_DESAR|nr:zinc-dependent alcohol dehydrogenase family protein [Desulfobacca acetoxidans]AEB10262.1 zinc-binding alcohol dehydrogenase family protein [Desulfobacca acetoxidans DSM 11109]HAY21843.1 zinc-binding alcohol dehydrogenase family protein [Desulfobacterales bacterium]